jgi:hypothetical protein
MRIWAVEGYTPYEGYSGVLAVFDHQPNKEELDATRKRDENRFESYDYTCWDTDNPTKEL